MASVSQDRTLNVWEWRAGRELWSETAHENSADAVAFSPDGQTIATVAPTGTSASGRWEIGRLALELPQDFTSTGTLEFSPDGRCLLAIARQGSFEIYDATPPK